MRLARKTRPEAVLKNLPREKQDAIIDYTDGRNGQKAHSLRATVEWLKPQGIFTSFCALGIFRRGYLMREQLMNDEAVALELIKTCKENGWIKTAEQERKAGQQFFNRLAIARQDPTMWVRLQQVHFSEEKVKLEKKKLRFEMKRREQAGEEGGGQQEPLLTPEERQRRIRQILGTE